MKKTMMLSALGLVASAGLAFADLPEGVSQADIDSFEAAMLASQCNVTNENMAGAVEDVTGFSQDKLTSIVIWMAGEDRVQFTTDPDGLRLISEACGN